MFVVRYGAVERNLSSTRNETIARNMRAAITAPHPLVAGVAMADVEITPQNMMRVVRNGTTSSASIRTWLFCFVVMCRR